MDFIGTWKVYSEENLEEFLKALGTPQMVIKMRKDIKPVTVFERKDDTWIYTIKTPKFSKTHSFCMGKESEVTTVDGRKIKCVIREENGKLITKTDKFTAVREMQGEDMVETITTGSVTFISRSKRV
ncbi:fatty acid-binding protein, liver-like [Corythoichthys intestinalis]|uniref:fatty acid-binding protein, liver-like n=1 Tax=Corythoichthys intestinalis TaxID=161448 RepID=UPI0025A68A60|nr:fatty acid-binding protein, liver-like [Corythoichthys intestinalis]XP_061808851.1 fatty acid-binding protein, liver-like [Nerophis lumbriciformis]